jgi:uncharacterized membrane protein YhaH (DUF805 family)
MLGFLFGFNARLTRMHYFLSTIALAVAMTAVCFAIAMYVVQRTPRAEISAADLMIWPTVLAIAAFCWMTLTLQCMRIRDIGWDPVCVIPAWIAILIVDHIVATKFASWAAGPEHQSTIVVGLVNLILFLALMFWPSGDYESSSFGGTPKKPDKPAQKTDAASVTAARIARATGAEFGRRGF